MGARTAIAVPLPCYSLGVLGAILHPEGPQLGPRWCESGPKRLRKGVISEPRGPPESIFRRVARKRVIYAKPTFLPGRTTNSAGPGRVRGHSGGAFLVNFLVNSPPWRPTSSKSRAKTAKMHQDGGLRTTGYIPVATQREPSGSRLVNNSPAEREPSANRARTAGTARPWRRGQRGVGG